MRPPYRKQAQHWQGWVSVVEVGPHLNGTATQLYVSYLLYELYPHLRIWKMDLRKQQSLDLFVLLLNLATLSKYFSVF